MAQTTTRTPRAREERAGAGPAQGAHVVTELTSKSLKVHLLWSYAVVAVGVLVAAAGSMVTANLSQDYLAAETVLAGGLGVCGLGVVWAFVTKVRIWWHHA